MKKTMHITLSAIVLVGGGYLIWRLTSLGKHTFKAWLMKRWKVLAKENAPEKAIEWGEVQQALDTFDCQTQEWLVAYTRLNLIGDTSISPEKEQKAIDLLKKLREKGVPGHEGMRQLAGVIFGT